MWSIAKSAPAQVLGGLAFTGGVVLPGRGCDVTWK